MTENPPDHFPVGDEQAVLDALRDVVGPSGTLVMPTQS
ncbi:AAC(3) family N-acetyltransferase [Saccharothrix sp. DSM 118769]